MLNAIGQFIYDVLKKSSQLLRSAFVFILSVFLLIFTLAFIAGILGSFGASDPGLVGEKLIVDAQGEDKIVYVPISGIIISESQGSVFAPAETVISPGLFRDVLSKATSDPYVKAVVFDINSPGGSPVASDRIYEQLVDFKQKTKKPVVFLMGEIAASGGYYIASASDLIVANPSTLTGSIGVIMETYNLEELYKKIGVSKTTFKQGEYKDILSESRPITEEERRIIDHLNENTYNLFISRVAAGRRKSEDEIKSLANGRIYSGSEAKDLGLVDSLGNFNEAIYQAKSLANIQNYQVVEYATGSVWKELLGSVKAFSPANLISSLKYYPQSYWVQK